MQAINYFVANNYMKALESLAKAPNQKVILMPLEAVVRDRLARRPGADHVGGVRGPAGSAGRARQGQRSADGALNGGSLRIGGRHPAIMWAPWWSSI